MFAEEIPLIKPELAEDDADEASSDALSIALARLANRTPEERLAERERAMKRVRKGRPLPEGMTAFVAAQGLWPGNETDEEIREALERLS